MEHKQIIAGDEKMNNNCSSAGEHENMFMDDSGFDSFGRISDISRSSLYSLVGDMLPIGVIGGYCEEGFPLYYVSSRLYRMMGYDTYNEFSAAIQGMVSNTIYYEDLEKVKKDIGNEFYAGMEYTTSYRMPHKNGSLFWVIDKGRVVEAEQGRLAILSFCMDITDIMEQQEAALKNVNELKQKNFELQHLNNTIPVGYHRCADTPDYDFLFVSNKFLEMLGYTRQDIKNLYDDKFRNMVHPEDWDRVFGGSENAEAALHTDLTFEYRIKSRNGYIWVEDHTDYVTGMGKPFFQGTILDVTERVKLREQLNTNIKAFQIAAKETGNLVFTYNRNEQVIYCDEWIAKEFGVEKRQEGIPYGILERGGIVSEDTAGEYLRIHEAILRGEKEAGGIVKLNNAEGDENIFDLKLQTIFDDNGNPSELAVGVYKDITEQYIMVRNRELSLQSLKKEYDTTREKFRSESREQLDMIYALSRDYYALWKVDIDNDLINLSRSETVNPYRLKENEPTVPEVYSESLELFAGKWVHPDDREMLLREASIESIRERLKKEEAFSIRLRRMEQGTDVFGYVEWRIARLPDSQSGQSVLIAVKDIDLTVSREMQQKDLLRDALNQAERASLAKTTFLSNMSHDIRTPMNAIIGFAGIAAGHIDNKERVKDCLGKILSSGNHLMSLINDILDMSRIESGKIELQEKECNLSERIHNLVYMIRPQIKAKRLELFVDTVDIRDEDLIFDPLKLDQILINILGNAVKFTPPGGIVSFTIRQCESDKPGYSHYEFKIRDTGIGMSEEFLQRIFVPFEQENSLKTPENEGTGLGMAITKNMVDLMGGTIEVESRIDRGSTFTVGFDFRRQDIVRRQEELRELEGLRALVVDDDFNVCDSVTGMLSEIGMRSEWTTSGREAVFRAQKAHNDGDPFHSYIIDWIMPQMDGLETVRRIRRVIGEETPIIVLTAYDWTDIEEEAREAGVTAFCSKPLFMSDLRSVLVEANHLSVKKEDNDEKKKPDFRGIRVLAVDDNELNREIAKDILENQGFEVETASDGMEAVEMVAGSAENYYNLILMDVQMPMIDGYEATRIIRGLKRPDAETIPIIAMTANAFDSDRELALKNGMNAHITKPLDVNAMLDTLDNILSESHKRLDPAIR